MGAWIEIENIAADRANFRVAPFMGAWIEIKIFSLICNMFLSLPSWERGLKSHTFITIRYIIRRSLHGSVD